MNKIDKNKKIKETYLATKAKRLNQSCKVYKVKIQNNKLNLVQEENLKMLFIEAKRLYNYILNVSKTSDIFKMTYNDFNSIKYFDKNKNEITYELIFLSSQMKQSILDNVFTNIRNLSKKKNKGLKVGQLKFLKDFKTISLKQYNVSYKLTSKNKIKIQGIKKPLFVNGLKQILSLKDYELANAKLIKELENYYLAITVYINKEKSENIKKQEVGIDFGCQTTLTLSTGEKINFSIEESEKIKRLKRKLSKSLKNSNNRKKIMNKINKLNKKVDNKKNDFVNKLVSKLKNYNLTIQDEQLSNWQKNGHGKKIMQGVLGRLKYKIKNLENTFILHKYIPTTKHCNSCGNSIDIKQWDKKFNCKICNIIEDRDIYASKNMLWFKQNIIGVEHTKFKPVDFKNNLINYYKDLKQEAINSLG